MKIQRVMRNLMFLLLVSLFGAILSCSSGTSASPTAVNDDAMMESEDGHSDGDDHASTLDKHEAEEHVHLDESEHAAAEKGASEHSHGEAMVDPDAPVVHVFAKEFGYTAEVLEAHAEEPFTIMLHNEGTLEHDITIEGYEDMGGIHLLSHEDGKATFELHESGEYTVYCTVPGHREAGMEATLTIVADDHGDDDHA